MYATCSDRHARSRRGQRGFTMIELIAVMVLMAIVAVAVLPKMDSLTTMRGAAWRDQVVGALRHAQAMSHSHRRTVCVSVATGAVTLTIAATNPAAACGGALSGIDGNAAWARDAAAPATAVAPAGLLYFQPSGRVTTSLGGSTTSDRSITISGETPITLTAETGHVE